jgi:class 3 adenylate cyclase
VKNLSIGQKIVGLSVALLSLMLAASIYSWVQARRVRDAAADFTAALTPLSREAAAIETNTLEQALMLERAMRHLTSEDKDLAQSDNEMARFRTLGDEIEDHLNSAGKVIESGLQRARVIDDAVQLARIEPEIANLRREHAAYLTAGMALYDATRDAKPGAKLNQLLADQFSTHEDRVDDVLDRLSGRLAMASEVETGRLAEREARSYLLSGESLALAVIAFFTGGIVSAGVTRRMVKPVRALISAVEKVSTGNLDVTVEVTTRDEIGFLGGAFQHMIGELRAKERIKSTFGKYMDPRVVDRLLLSDGRTGIAAGEKRVMTVYFSDLEGFSGISESLTAAGLVNLINHYLTLASEPIVREQGVIDKYIGDAVMAFWGPPFYEAADHARRACLAALAQKEQLAELRRTLPDILGIRRNLPVMNARIGLCTGELIVGSIGSNISKSFTVMGDTVNTASRLEGANKQFGTDVLIDGSTHEMVVDSMETRELDYIGVVGKADAVRVYELLGERGKVEAPRLALRDDFEAGLSFYRRGAWDEASAQFNRVLASDPDDKPARLFLVRIQQFRETPPEAGWDGVWRLTTK